MARKRRKFTEEFKFDAVRLAQQSDRSVGRVAKDLGVAETVLRRWIKQYEIDRGRGPSGAITTEERHELTALRKRVRELEMEREILKKAAAFFAKEGK